MITLCEDFYASSDNFHLAQLLDFQCGTFFLVWREKMRKNSPRSRTRGSKAKLSFRIMFEVHLLPS